MVNKREILDTLESMKGGLWGNIYYGVYKEVLPRLTGDINLIRESEHDIKVSFLYMAGKNSPLRYLIKTDEALIEWLNKLVNVRQDYDNLATLVFCSTYNLEPNEIREFLRISTYFNTYHDESRWLKIHECLENGGIFTLYETTNFLRQVYGVNISREQVRANRPDVLKVIMDADTPLDFTRAFQGFFTNNDIIAMGLTHRFLREHYRPFTDGMTVREANKFFTKYGNVAFTARGLMEKTYRHRVIDFLRKEITEEGVN